MLLNPPPITFFGGKGGVGKTTLAAATARNLAQAGRSVLLVSTDPAHNLGHIWGTTLSDAPTILQPGLTAIELDPARTTEEHLRSVGANLRKFMPEHLHKEITRHLDLARNSPGTHEAALLERIAELIEHAEDYDHLIFDTAPSGHTTRLLELPEVMAAYTDGLLARREKSEKFGSLVSGMAGSDNATSTRADPTARRNQEIRSTLLKRRRRFEKLRAALSDTQRTGFYIVLTPERLPVLESTELYAELTDNGIRVAGLIVNRCIPEEAGEFLAARRAAEQDALELLKQRLPDEQPLLLPWLPQEIGDADALDELAQRI